MNKYYRIWVKQNTKTQCFLFFIFYSIQTKRYKNYILHFKALQFFSKLVRARLSNTTVYDALGTNFAPPCYKLKGEVVDMTCRPAFD